jgi:hypothetical protein
MADTPEQRNLVQEIRRFLQTVIILTVTGVTVYLMSLALPMRGERLLAEQANRFLLIAVVNLVFFYTFRGLKQQSPARLFTATSLLAAFMSAMQYVLYHLFF